MDRRTFFAALGGLCFSTTALRAQDAGLPLVGDIFGAGANVAGGALNAGGDVLGGTLGAGGDILGGAFGGGLDGGDSFRLTDLMGGEYAIETSRLALQRSRSAQIRNFAQLEINEQVSVTAALGATPGSVPPRPDQAAMVRRLASLRSGAFDHAYVVGQIRGHEELLANNTQAINSAAEPAVRRVATLSVPTIQTHLAILRRLRAGLPSV